MFVIAAKLTGKFLILSWSNAWLEASNTKLYLFFFLLYAFWCNSTKFVVVLIVGHLIGAGAIALAVLAALEG